jgi:predicted amidohydrolase YtcJ
MLDHDRFYRGKMHMDHQHADAIWTGGQIKTMNPQQPVVQALAVKDGRLIALGRDTDVRNLAGPRTAIHDLKGRFVMPGLIESHAHALWGACRDLFDVYVGYEASFDNLLHAVKARVGNVAAGTFILGGPWRPDMLAQMGDEPRKILDQIAPAHPIALQDVTQHSLWCNTAALEAAGITATSADIAGGVIERDPKTNAPTGILAETACVGVQALAARTPAQLAQACDHFTKYFNALGFTAFREPMAFEAELAAYKAADDRGALTVHMGAHIVRSSPFSTQPVPYEEMERLRNVYQSENVRTGFAKLFLDGVAPSFTASFIEPYLESAGYDATDHEPADVLLIDPDTMADTMTELDARGFVVKTHAVGDFAVRTTLDAIEAARKRNGHSGLRHEVSHCPFVTDADLGRFAQLDAVAEMSPKLWFPNPATAGQIRVLGQERVERLHPFRSLLDAGAELVYASDWPAAAPDANPWTGLAGMISRQSHSGSFDGTVGADQAISLDEALPLFTQNPARALGMERDTGALEAGKWADFIVLERPLAQMTAAEIAHVEVEVTVWKGQVVHTLDA